MNTLERSEAVRQPIGQSKVGQHIFRLYSGRLQFVGTVTTAPVKEGGSSGYTLGLINAKGDEVSTWGGAATQFYVKAEASHTEAFTNLTDARGTARAAQASEKAKAREEADRLRLAGRSDDQTTTISHPGRSSATPTDTEVTPMSKSTTTKQTAKATEAEATPTIDLHAQLQEQLAAVGIEVKLHPSPAYFRYLVEGTTIGYVWRQTAKATIKAKPGLTMADLPRGLKAAFKPNPAEPKYAVVGTFTEKDLGKLVQALQLAASLQAQAREAKAAAKAAKAFEAEAPAAEPAPAKRSRAKAKAVEVEATAVDPDQAAAEQLAAQVILGEVTFAEAVTGILGDQS